MSSTLPTLDHVLWSAPESERAGRPLLVMLHGHRSDEADGFSLRHHLPAEFVVASVRAPLAAPGGGYAWFPLDPLAAPPFIGASTEALLAWLDRQPAASTVGVLGFSQGAATGLQLLRLAPLRFDFAVALSGFVIPGPAVGDATLARTRPPVFCGRGDRDLVIPPLLTQLAGDWLRTHATLTERVYPGLGHSVNAAELADVAAFLRDQTDSTATGQASGGGSDPRRLR